MGFVGFYVYRLVVVRKQDDSGADRRLELLLRAEAAAPQRGAGPFGKSREGGASVPAALAEPTGSAPLVVHEKGPGLRDFTEETVFMRRDRAGEVSFQLGDKPAMPLKFLLDAHGRKVLNEVAMRATLDFGQTWAVLAAEDEEGRLTVTRLA